MDDAAEAFRISVANGGVAVQEPTVLGKGSASQTIAEVKLYGDVVLRYVSGNIEVSDVALPGCVHVSMV